MMASFSLHPTTAAPSQLVPGNISHIPSRFPTATATTGFRPSIPPKNSRVPTGDIDKLSFSKMNNQANGKFTKFTSVSAPISTAGGTQPLPPPPLPHPPARGISNAQARTARKSAPSTSNRGDGYSTSSSGGGGKKSISSATKNSGEKRNKVFPSLNEEGSLSDNDPSTEDPSLMSPEQTPIAASPKSQLQTQFQAQQNTLEKSQEIEMTSPVVPAPPSLAGPSTQATSAKRPAPPTLPSSNKPKRQKIATAKAVAIAGEPRMSADGSVIKKRKPRKNPPEKGSKEGDKGKGKEKLNAVENPPEKGSKEGDKGKGKEKLNAVDTPPAVVGDRCGLGETNSGSSPAKSPPPAKPQRTYPEYHPGARYEKPIKRNPQPTTAEMILTAVGDLKSNSIKIVWTRAPKTAGRPKPDNVISVPKLVVQAPDSVGQIDDDDGDDDGDDDDDDDDEDDDEDEDDDVILASSLPLVPITQQTAASKLGGRTQNASNKKLAPRDDELGRNQHTPIAIDSSSEEEEEEEETPYVRPQSKNCGRADIGVRNHETGKPTVRNHHDSPGPPQVSDEFFTKCIDTSLSDDERVKLVVEIEKFIVALVAEAKKHSWVPKPSSKTKRFLPREQDSSTLGKITALLEHTCVLTNEGKFITLDEWKDSGMSKFQGRFILQDYRDVWKEGHITKNSESGTPLGGELRPTKNLNQSTTDVDMVDVADQQAVSPVRAFTTPQATANINSSTIISGKTKKASVNDKPKENLALVNSALQSKGTISLPPNSLISPPPEKRAPPAKNPMPPQSLSQNQLSPSTQLQAEAGVPNANLTPTSEISAAAASNKLSSKGRKKRFEATSVQDFLNEAKICQEQPTRAPNSDAKQERNDPLLIRITELHQEELHVRDDIEALFMKSKLEEAKFERRITGAGIFAKAGVNGGESNSGLGITDDLANSPVDWEEFRRVTRELRDFQDDTRRAELKLTDKAIRIAEEKKHLIQRRKEMKQTEIESVTTRSITTSEERSLGNEDSTAPSSVSGSSAPRQGIPPPTGVVARTAHPETSVGHELLRGLIPWARQIQEIPTDSTHTVSTETGTNQTKSKRKPPRRKKRW